MGGTPLCSAACAVVELGCAGGVRYFGLRYHAVGCDLSFASLKRVEGYEQRVQADASVCIPLPNNSVDAVVSSYFWEHIPPEVKPRILSEASRILRPNGKLIFLYDLETKNPLIRHFKLKDPTLYERLFIAGDGHFGYQHSVENLTIFEQAGFRISEHYGMEKTWLLSPSAYSKLAQFGAFGSGLFASASRLGQRPFFRSIYSPHATRRYSSLSVVASGLGKDRTCCLQESHVTSGDQWQPGIETGHANLFILIWAFGFCKSVTAGPFLPNKFPSPATFWRRLRRWEEQRGWLGSLLLRLPLDHTEALFMKYTYPPVAIWMRSSQSRVNRFRAAFQCNGLSHFAITFLSVRYMTLSATSSLGKAPASSAVCAGTCSVTPPHWLYR